jgi:hypothetical protein
MFLSQKKFDRRRNYYGATTTSTSAALMHHTHTHRHITPPRAAAKLINYFQPYVVLVSRFKIVVRIARARCIYFRTEFLARIFPWGIAI